MHAAVYRRPLTPDFKSVDVLVGMGPPENLSIFDKRA
jgi:hypothetical protein